MSPDIRNISDGKLMKTWQNFTQQTRRARKKDVQKEVDIDEPILHTPSNTNSIHNPNRNEVLESSIGINELMESCDTDQGSEITKSNPSTEPQPKKRRKQYVTLGNEHLTFICNRVEYFKKTNTNQYGIWPQVTKEFFIKYDIDISEGAIKKKYERYQATVAHSQRVMRSTTSFVDQSNPDDKRGQKKPCTYCKSNHKKCGESHGCLYRQQSNKITSYF
jgi:hypothetical protein